MVIALSFFSSQASLTKGYSASELYTSTFVSAFDKGSSVGTLEAFYKLLIFYDAYSRNYVFDEILYHPIYDVQFFLTKQSNQPTLYGASTIVRTSQEVAFFHAAFGMGYPDFWGKVDRALNSNATRNRMFDTGSEQVFTTVTP